MSFPVSAAEVERLRALRELRILDTAPEEQFDAVCRTAQRMFSVPIAVVSLLEEDRQWFKARCGLDAEGTPREVAFCNHTILSDEVVVVEDATRDERFRTNPVVTGDLGLRFYAGAPLVLRPGIRVGTVCIVDTVPRTFSVEQRSALQDLAKIVVAHLRQHETAMLREDELVIRRANETLIVAQGADLLRREAELQERGHYLALAEEMAGLGRWRVNLPDQGIYWSDQVFHLHGLDPAQGPPTIDTAINAYHPDDRAEVERCVSDAIQNKTSFEHHSRIMRPDGEVRFVVSRGMPELDQEGRVKALVGVFMDVTDYTRAGDTLRASEQRLKLALSTTKLGLWDLDVNTGVRQWSDEMREILGVSGEVQASREVFLTRLHPEDRARLQNERYPLLPNGTSRHRSVLRILRADNGDERWIEVAGEMLHDEDGRPTRYIGLVQDITARRTAEEALRASEERLRLALQAGRMFAWERDLATGYVERSSNAKDLIGIGSGPVSDFIERLHPADQEKGPAVTTGEWGSETEQSELRYIRPDGRLMWLAARSTLFRETGRPERLIGVTFDITDRKAAEEDLWRVANQDSLTGLPNRAMFHRRLEEALSEAQRDGTSVSLLLIDLDGFKDVNDTLGHDAGDALLVETAKRLGEFVRDGDTVARLGGDEFAVVLVAPFELTNAASLAEHVIARLSQSFTYADRIVPSRASAGVAGFPEHHHTPSELLKDADLALYRAKAQGRNRVVTYAPEMREATERRVTIAREVQEAVREGQIVPFYQPKVSFTTGRIIGFEALARWQHPTKGVLTPGYFGSVFEDPELAVAIGESIVSQVAADIRTWLDRGLDCGRVAVNLSSAEFADPYLAVNTLGLLREAEVPLEHFEVEVTETVLLGRSADYVGSILRRFHESGVRIALDDFGTGFASLTHLKQFPVDHIKVDQSFVRDLEHDRDDAAIVAAVIGLGRSLGIEVTAEGVETVGQAGHLRQMGCTNAQGYLYAKPMVGSRVPWLLETWANPFALSDGKSRRAASGAIP